ncbi:pentapeptide repeat-containing protein [Streptomyces sp. NPDC012466]|uniref:pentapeptide repeat-containing protein n=1 Tax=Streptomyces sp. NPDC012466 TaxID=3364835 RepID=UPI0036E5D8D2
MSPNELHEGGLGRLRSARLGGARLRSARLRGARLRGARLRGARLRSARLRGARLLDRGLLGGALARRGGGGTCLGLPAGCGTGLLAPWRRNLGPLRLGGRLGLGLCDAECLLHVHQYAVVALQRGELLLQSGDLRTDAFLLLDVRLKVAGHLVDVLRCQFSGGNCCLGHGGEPFLGVWPCRDDACSGAGVSSAGSDAACAARCLGVVMVRTTRAGCSRRVMFLCSARSSGLPCAASNGSVVDGSCLM